MQYSEDPLVSGTWVQHLVAVRLMTRLIMQQKVRQDCNACDMSFEAVTLSNLKAWPLFEAFVESITGFESLRNPESDEAAPANLPLAIAS